MKITTGALPIYRQIIDDFELKIASGRLEPGEKIDSIRSLALQFQVNPNTIQKALSELERDGYIYTDRTNGKFVSEDVTHIKQLKNSLMKNISTEFIVGVKKFGFNYDETIEYLKEAWEEKHDTNY